MTTREINNLTMAIASFTVFTSLCTIAVVALRAAGVRPFYSLWPWIVGYVIASAVVFAVSHKIARRL